MKWYHYIAVFFAGLFLTNAVPHFIHGISGDPFPTPFADPPGKGLSPPTLNVIWALANIAVGYLLLRVSKLSRDHKMGILVFFMGMILAGIALSHAFMDKMH